MVKVKPPHAASAVLAAIVIASTTHNDAQAFQPARLVALPPTVTIDAPFATSTSPSMGAAANINNLHQRRPASTINMTAAAGRSESSQSSREISLFGSSSQKARRALRKARRSFAILVASFAFFLSSTRVHAPPAHAASAATSSTPSLVRKLNPFRTRTADEMIDAYVRDRLFADDEFDPVESAYREAFADYAPGQAAGKEGAAATSGAYPALLAETAGSALGRQRSVSSVLSSSTSRGVGASSASGRNDGITAVLIRASDVLQSRLKVSASVSYYILAGVGIFGVCTVPGLLGVLYSGLQRIQIDKSEMKMYGKITDMDATSKKVADDDDDDDEE